MLIKTTNVKTTYRNSVCHVSESVLASTVIPEKRRIMTDPETIRRLRIEIFAPYMALMITNIAFGTLLAEIEQNGVKSNYRRH